MSKLRDEVVVARRGIPNWIFGPDGKVNLCMLHGPKESPYKNIGIGDNIRLIIDLNRVFIPGSPSCFKNYETGDIRLDIHHPESYEHLGKLVGTVPASGDLCIWKNGKNYYTGVNLDGNEPHRPGWMIRRKLRRFMRIRRKACLT